MNYLDLNGFSFFWLPAAVERSAYASVLVFFVFFFSSEDKRNTAHFMNGSCMLGKYSLCLYTDTFRETEL